MKISTDTVDRVKGAFIASAFGDALGRFSEKNVQHEAITSFSQLPPCDWIYEPYKQKEAPYSTHTVLALITYNNALIAREQSLSVAEITEQTARSFTELFGADKYSIDSHFNYRKHPESYTKAAERLAQCIKFKKAVQCDLCLDNESSPLARAWPLGIVFADDPEKAALLASHQTTLTHAHPAVRISAMVLVYGIAAAGNGETVDQILAEMIYRADTLETRAQKSEEHVFLVDLLRAARTGQHVYLPKDRVHSAYETLAFVATLLVKHAENPYNALLEAANSGQQSSLNATLTGAFIGLMHGFNYVRMETGYQINFLENVQYLSEEAEKLPVFLSRENRPAAAHYSSRVGKFLTYSCIAGLVLGSVCLASAWYY